MTKRLACVSLLAVAVCTVFVIGCARVETSPVAVSAPAPAAAIPAEAAVNEAAESQAVEAPVNVVEAPAIPSQPDSPATADTSAAASPSQEAAESTVPSNARRSDPPRDRPLALGQFGGGMDMGGGMGGGMGGMGGGMGGMGGGMGGGGGGGVSIDPKISLKRESSGKLDVRRKEAMEAKPTKGGFSK